LGELSSASSAQPSSVQENLDPVQLSSAQRYFSAAKLSSEKILQIYNSGGRRFFLTRDCRIGSFIRLGRQQKRRADVQNGFNSRAEAARQNYALVDRASQSEKFAKLS
jgi:hypothetical protein